MVIVAKIPPRELHSGMAGIDFPRPLPKAGGEDYENDYNDTSAC
jgi:hypothetical protein